MEPKKEVTGVMLGKRMDSMVYCLLCRCRLVLGSKQKAEAICDELALCFIFKKIQLLENNDECPYLCLCWGVYVLDVFRFMASL